MTCSDFIDRFSEYFDRVGDDVFIEEADGHLSSCPSCRRYLEVFERGRELFRSSPTVRVGGDFYPRLKHRVFHLEDADALARGSAGSATTAVTILGMAVLLTLVAWSPLIRAAEQKAERAAEVNRPTTDGGLGLRPRPVTFSAGTLRFTQGFERTPQDLWERPEVLLWEYSPLFEGYGQTGGLRRVSLD